MRALTSLFVAAGSVFGAQTALGYQTVMIRDSGPADNRVNIVILGDGYLASELSQLQSDVRAAFATIDSEPFYAEYANFINVKLVLTSSPSNVIGNGAPGSTLFGLYFGCQGIDRLICIGDPAQVVEVLNQDAPEWDLVAIIANSPFYGGSGGQFVTFTHDTTSTQLLIHEAAHQFATLADEYPDAYPAYPVCTGECPEPNVTPYASPWQNLKWNYWVSPATPLPTPDTAQYASTVGAFEGARYQSTGLFRPRHTCRMRATDQTFCEVCSEAHVLEAYRLVNDFDSTTPSSNQISIAADGSLSLSVAHPQTRRNSIQYTWSVDNVGVNGSGSSLNLTGTGLGVGDHTVSVRLSDTTPFAGRDDPLLHKTRTWQLRVTAAGGTGGAPGSGGTTSTASGGGSAGTLGGSATTIGGDTGSGGTRATTSSAGGTVTLTGGSSTIATTRNTSVASGGATYTTGGTLPSSSGSTVALTGGSSAITTSNTGTASGSAAYTTGGTLPSSSGGTMARTGGSSAIMTTSNTGAASGGAASGGAGNAGASNGSFGGTVNPTGGNAGNSTTALDAGSDMDRDVKGGCNCTVPATNRHPMAVAVWGAIGWLLLRRRTRMRRP
jgi:hypothetical protein